VNPVRDAIYDRLAAHAPLTALLSSPTAIHHRKAPRETVPPFVVFNKQAGMWEHAFQGGRITREMWLVKAIDDGPSASLAEDVAKAIDGALNGVTLTLSTGDPAYVLHSTDIDYDEQDGAEQWQHVGAIYRVIDP
jgi:hypothetical protein